MLPKGWQDGDSSAIRAFCWLPEEGVLKIAYTRGRHAYDFPCTSSHYEAFLAARSRGQYVERVLRPYARERGWSRGPYTLSW